MRRFLHPLTSESETLIGVGLGLYELARIPNSGSSLRRIYRQEGKRCMLAFLKLVADFSRGCAHPAMQPPIPATHPHPATQENRSLIARAPALASKHYPLLTIRSAVRYSLVFPTVRQFCE